MKALLSTVAAGGGGGYSRIMVGREGRPGDTAGILMASVVRERKRASQKVATLFRG